MELVVFLFLGALVAVSIVIYRAFQSQEKENENLYNLIYDLKEKLRDRIRALEDNQNLHRLNIQSNMGLLGIEDISVMLRIESKDGATIPVTEMPIPLSIACSMTDDLIAAKLGTGYGWLGKKPYPSRLTIYSAETGNFLGSIENRAFAYEASNDLRGCLAWAVVTGPGRHQDLRLVNLNDICGALTQTIQRAPFGNEEVLRDYWRDIWCKEVQEQFGFDASFETDGYGYWFWWFEPVFWRVGCRTLLSKTHQGYPMCLA